MKNVENVYKSNISMHSILGIVCSIVFIWKSLMSVFSARLIAIKHGIFNCIFLHFNPYAKKIHRVNPRY